jgi:hypothetical protein
LNILNGSYITYIWEKCTKASYITYMYNVNQNQFLTCGSSLCLFIFILNYWWSFLNCCKILVWPHCLCNDTSFCSCYYLFIFEMTLSLPHFQMISWTSMSLCHQSWMPCEWNCNKKAVSSFVLPCYHILVKCSTNIWL